MTYTRGGQFIDGRVFKIPEGEDSEISMERARKIVRGYVDQWLAGKGEAYTYDVYVVWFSRLMGNWKAFISTSIPDMDSFQIWYDHDRDKTYVEVFRLSASIEV